MKSQLRMMVIGAVLLSLVPAPASFGQVVARQGTSESTSKKTVITFESPMILELPLKEVLQHDDGFEHFFKELTNYACEGIIIQQLKSIRSKTSEAKGTTLVLASVVRGDKNLRKVATILFEIVSDDAVLASKKTPFIELERGSKKEMETRFKLDGDQLAKLRSAITPLLRLTVALEKNPGDYVREADEATVSGCEFLGTVSGHSMVGGLAAPIGAENAMKAARVKAESLGATHIVFVAVSGGNMVSTGASTARAYRCR
jgi:hypothetical protein